MGRKQRTVQSLFVPGAAGRLEALWETPTAAREDWAGLVCHPHPLYAGTMHNKVVHHASLALQELGLRVLRFNFRGVNLSSGSHDGGPGEADDVRAALAWLNHTAPAAGVVLAGFSFGSWVGMRVGCEDDRTGAVIGIGLPANNGELEFLENCTKPKLFVQGTRDPFGSVENVLSVVRRAADPKQVIFVEEADHFFTGRLEELRSAIVDNFPLPLAGPAAGQRSLQTR